MKRETKIIILGILISLPCIIAFVLSKLADLFGSGENWFDDLTDKIGRWYMNRFVN